MTVQAWIIATEAQKNDAEAMNPAPPGARVEGRLVNNAMADSLGEGTLTGKYVFAARLLNAPAYAAWAEPSTAFPDGLGALPIRAMDSDVLFAPPGPDED